jgi:DNA-binding beta-propeller fold protein YncE
MRSLLRRASAATIILVLAGCGSEGAAVPSNSASASTKPTAEPASPSPTVDAGAALDARTEALIEMGGGPDMPTEGFGSVWVLAVDGPIMNDGTEPAVHRIDPATNEIVASVPLPGRVCQGIGVSPEAVWACGPDGLVRIDPATNEVVATVPLDAPVAVSRLAYGAGSVWAFATTGVAADTVVRIDPATNAVTSTISLGHAAGTMVFAAEALFVSSPADDLVLRIDPATDTAEEWVSGLDGAGWLAATDDRLWVALYGDVHSTVDPTLPSVVAVSPVDGEALAEVVTGGQLLTAGGLAADADGVWVRAPQPYLVRVDAATFEVVDRIDAREGPGDVALAFGSLWATAEEGDVTRVDPEAP